MQNQRCIVLADQEPKVFGGELRARVAPKLRDTVVNSQHGEGLGASSCVVASLILDGMAHIAETASLCGIRIHVDVIEAYASILTAMVLPQSDKLETVRDVLAGMNFTTNEIDETYSWNLACPLMSITGQTVVGNLVGT